ncbi:MAG: hypothetical protein HPY46_06780 [Candidatus Aminicenantes bacterium]|nr:hypothetical protein [Candidatus Aminicenantes bacterium]
MFSPHKNSDFLFRRIRIASVWVIVSCLFLFIFHWQFPAYSQQPTQIADYLNKFITWRNIGPAVPGGRTVDLDVVGKKPWIIYAAVGPSGLWKSENNGFSWVPVFQREATVSVGAVAVAQSAPEVVWVGTGESTSRNSVTLGDGVYRSTDGGKTWKNMGLKDTRHISRIIISRGDPNIVYVAAMGHLWGPNSERGIYKTIDGGESWKKILYVNENTGFSDLEMDPENSQVLYAAAYEHRRWPYRMVSGGPGSGIYRSTDGGLTWTRLKQDLPEGIMGRIGLAVARNRPGVVYALIEHQDPGIWRSEDYGQTWKRTCDAKTYKNVNNRPFYYSHIYVDPNDDRTVYVQSTGLYVSNDMGQKFRAIGQGTHPDHHALWIDPANPLHLIDGNDGGIDITYDGGKTWLPVTSIDAAEVYQVGFDYSLPYRVYCGLQDNGCWGGPSHSLDPRGILNEHWEFINGGDGFFVRPDPKNSFVVYCNSQNNGLVRKDLRHGLGKGVRPEASLNEPPYRFNWNAPIMISPHDNNTIYCAGNFLFKSKDGGYTWEKISPDLTTNDPTKQVDGVGPITVENSGAEVHCTITAIAESPVQAGVLWCGTDDGNLQVSRDGGQTWANVVRNIPGLPKNSWCSRVEASHFEAGTAYVSFDNHRSDDYSPYIYKTTDFGKTWKSLRSNLPDFGWVHVVREHPENRNLLFVGTEFGIYVSYNSGLSWIKIHGSNLPTVAVHDIAIHPRENDLIIGTHGRGIWILDDICYLSQFSQEAYNSDFYLFKPRPAYLFFNSSRGDIYSTFGFRGSNPAAGIGLTYFVRTDLSGDFRISIRSGDQEQIIELPLQKKAGLNRTYWNLQFVPKTAGGERPQMAGIMSVMCNIAPGEYDVLIKIGDKEHKSRLKVLPDPRFELNPTELQRQYQVVAELSKTNNLYARATAAARNISRDLEKTASEIASIKDEVVRKQAQDQYRKFMDSFNAVSEIFQTEGTLVGLSIPYQKFLRGPINIKLITLIQGIAGYPSAPTTTELKQAEEVNLMVRDSIQKLNEFIKNELDAFNRFLESNKLTTLKKPELLSLDN